VSEGAHIYQRRTPKRILQKLSKSQRESDPCFATTKELIRLKALAAPGNRFGILVLLAKHVALPSLRPGAGPTLSLSETFESFCKNSLCPLA
jgi:hypothetical protein